MEQEDRTTASNSVDSLLQPDFSLVLGGPLYQLMRRAHLSDDALLLVRQRITVFVLITWLPLLILSLIEGTAFEAGSTVTFFKDFEAHTRFLVAMPFLILAELIIHQRMRPLLRQFEARGLIPPEASKLFSDAIARALRLRNSVSAEILLLVIVYVLGISVIWRHYLALDTSTWYAQLANGERTLSVAGWWYGYVSLPIFQFLLLRWYFRLFIWTRFLWQISRIKLAIAPTHPDRLGGLGFISNQIYALSILGVAHGALLSGNLANQIIFVGASLPQFKVEIALVVLYILLLILGPLTLFVPQLASAKRTGLYEYGNLAQQYVRQFDSKWVRNKPPADDPLLGSADIQSLADLSNSFEVVRSMRIVPVRRDDVIRLVIATLAPIVPLGLTMMSLEDLIRTLLKVVF